MGVCELIRAPESLNGCLAKPNGRQRAQMTPAPPLARIPGASRRIDGPLSSAMSTAPPRTVSWPLAQFPRPSHGFATPRSVSSPLTWFRCSQTARSAARAYSGAREPISALASLNGVSKPNRCPEGPTDASYSLCFLFSLSPFITFSVFRKSPRNLETLGNLRWTPGWSGFLYTFLCLLIGNPLPLMGY